MRRISINEAANRLGVNRQTIRRWTDKGIIKPAMVYPSGYRVYHEDEIERLENQEPLTTGDVADLLGVSETAVRKWDRRGDLVPASKTPGGHRRYTYDQVSEMRAKLRP